ncbi:MAG TPA: hypothetical protein DCS05_02415 [Nitrospiraceae bacterium]|nr:hypothetical protein [Nitrospiraceae bacterium]
MADLKTTARLQMLADIIVEQSTTIMQQAEQIGRLNEMLQQERAAAKTAPEPGTGQAPSSK